MMLYMLSWFKRTRHEICFSPFLVMERCTPFIVTFYTILVKKMTTNYYISGMIFIFILEPDWSSKALWKVYGCCSNSCKWCFFIHLDYTVTSFFCRTLYIREPLTANCKWILRLVMVTSHMVNQSCVCHQIPWQGKSLYKYGDLV